MTLYQSWNAIMFLLQKDVPKARQTLAQDTPKNARQPQHRPTIPGLCQACIAMSCVGVFVCGRLHISTDNAIRLNKCVNACVHIYCWIIYWFNVCRKQYWPESYCDHLCLNKVHYLRCIGRTDNNYVNFFVFLFMLYFYKRVMASFLCSFRDVGPTTRPPPTWEVRGRRPTREVRETNGWAAVFSITNSTK